MPKEAAGMIRTYQDVTPTVLAAMAQTPDPRLKEIMTALVRHLHGFILETRLTEDEFRAATAILKEMGELTDDKHQEFVLMAGSLGVSALVCLLNNGEGGNTETTQNLLGPFWRLNSPRVENGGSLIRSDTPGPAMRVRGRITDPAGVPIAGAEVDVWHASPVGLYENQDPEQAEMNLRGKFTTDSEGRFWFWSVRPAGYPIPTDGVVGRLLAAQGRQPMRPAHVHVLAYKPGFKTLISQVYADGDDHLADDPQFGVTAALTGRFVRHDTPPEDGPGVAAPWFGLDHAFTMERGEAKLPKPPIK
jgi:catechol 1,2-dioxygenase